MDADGEISLQTDCEAIASFLNLEGLKVNAMKTKILIVSVSPRETQPLTNPLKLNGVQVEEVDVLKYLGVDLDKRINFTHHSLRIANKARRMLHAIGNTLRKWHMRDEIKRIYITCIRPVLTYGISIVYGKSQEGKSALERVNRTASRMILNNYTDEYEDLLKTLDLSTIAWLSVEERLRWIHKLAYRLSTSESSNQPIEEIIRKVTSRRSSRLSNGFELCVHGQDPRLTRTKRTALRQMVKLWNMLPSNIVSQQNSTQFLTTIRNDTNLRSLLLNASE
jgi:hypothetical protein